MSAHNPMQPAANQSALADLLAEALPMARALLDHLNLERRALVGNDPAVLPGIFDRKAELATALEDIEARRSALCGRSPAGVAVEAAAFRALLPGVSQNDWDRYCDVLRECRDANAVNGRLARARHSHVRRALDILRGQSPNDPGVYTARGTAGNAGDSQVLGSA